MSWVPAVIGCALTCFAALFIGGCAVGPNLREANPQIARDHPPVDLRPMLRSEYRDSKRYIRYQASATPAKGVTYLRAATRAGRAEGSLRHFHPQSISAYLDPHSDRPDRRRASWPRSQSRNVAGFFIEFEPSLLEWPDHIENGVPQTSVARLLAFDGAGIPFARGSARRRVWLVGRDSVTVGGRHYSDCIRLRSETHLRFGWWATVQMDEEVWFAEGVGVVRRVHAVRGLALFLFPFSSSYVFDLQDDSSNSDGLSPTDGAASVERLPHWKRLAIHLDRIFPRPRVGGLVVEYETKGRAAP